MKKKSISTNFIFNLIYQVLTVLLPLVTTPYISRALGAESIGIYGYTLSIATWFTLIGSVGISMYGQREVARNQDDRKKYSFTFVEVVITRFITIMISLLIFFLVFGVKGNYTLYYRILSLYILSSAFDINWFFQGLENFSKTVLRNIIVKILSIFLIFWLVKKPEDLWIYITIFVCSELLGNMSIWLYLPRYLEKIDFKSLNLKKHIKPIMILFIPQIATYIYTVLDKTMIGLLTNDMKEVAYYEQSQKIARAALVIVSSLQLVMNSRVANASYKKDTKEIKRCLDISFNFIWIIGIPLMFGLIAISSNLVPWYYGSEFNRIIVVLRWIAPIILIIGLNSTTGVVYLIQTGRQKEYAWSVFIGAIINTILNFIFIPYYGSVGASVASIIAELSIFIYHLKYIKKVYSLKNIFLSSLKCLISGMIMFLVIWIIKDYFISSMLNSLLLVIIGAIIYVILLLLLRYKFLIDTINQVLNKFKKKAI